MAVAHESADAKEVAGSSASITISGVTLTGSDRCLIIGIGSTLNTARTYTISRGSDTFTQLGSRMNTVAFPRVNGHMYASSNEPATESTDLTVTDTIGINDDWGVCYVNCTGVNQTTRTENLTLNSDDTGTGGLPIDAMNVSSASGDLVVDFITAREVDDVFTAQSAGQTARATYSGGIEVFDNDGGIATKAGEGTCTVQWSAATDINTCVHYGVNVKKSGGTPPVNTVPAVGRAAGVFTTSASATDISSGLSISDFGTGTVTSVALSCNDAKLMVTLSGSVGITAGENNTSALTLGTSTTNSEYNTVLGTLTCQGDVGFHGKVTIQIITTTGDGSDTDSWYVLNDPRTLTLTQSGTYAQIVAAVESMQAKLDSLGSQDTINMLTTDDTARTDDDDFVVTSQSVAAGYGGGGASGSAIRQSKIVAMSRRLGPTQRRRV